jgi:penicillin amidase
MPSFPPSLRYVVLVCVVVVVALIGGVVWQFRASLPHDSGSAELKGLTAKVKIYRDTYGVPHIFAANRADALRALGYTHASERFFQMEMQRRAGQGRLSEAVGPSLLGVDKFIRTLGLYDLAQSSYAVMAPDTQKLIQAYADGINTWLAAHRDHLPPEFTLLGINPEPWQPVDSVVWGKLMSLQLSHNYRLEILRAQLAGKLSAQQMKMLFPISSDAPVTMEPKAIKKADASDHEDVLQKLSSITSLDHAASNEWVISGSRTQSGKPILANDPHLSLEAPILWYLASMTTPEGTLKGATVPGLPVVLLGQNNAIAWGMTTTGSDVEDLFIETVDPKNPAHYLTPKGSEAFATHKELIPVKGQEGVVLTIRSTRHGPVMSDIDEDMAKLAADGKVMALAFTGLGDKDRTSEALMKVDQATNWPEFLEAMKLYQGPPQNVVFADIKGDIGFINPGLVPIRKQGHGLMPVDGASGANDWTGTISFKEWPKLFNPAAGYVFNANNALVGVNSKNYYGVDWEEPYRAERLQQFFDANDIQTLVSSAAMQGDHLSLVARQMLPYLLRLSSDNARVTAALDLLRGWDGVMDMNRPEPLIFDAWLREMHQRLLVAQAGQPLMERGPYAASSIEAILTTNDNGWCYPSICEKTSLEAMQAALDWLTKRHGEDMKSWQWGSENRTLLTHKVFKHMPVLAGLSDLSVASSGDFYTLDRGGSFDPPDDQPFARQHGGGYRAIYDLANPDQSRFMITTGESGHIFSPHYGDLVHLWNDVKYITLSGTKEEMEGRNASLLELTP